MSPPLKAPRLASRWNSIASCTRFILLFGKSSVDYFYSVLMIHSGAQGGNGSTGLEEDPFAVFDMDDV